MVRFLRQDKRHEPTRRRTDARSLADRARCSFGYLEFSCPRPQRDIRQSPADGIPARLQCAARDGELFGVLTRPAACLLRSGKSTLTSSSNVVPPTWDEPFVPLDIEADYRRYVDGKPRDDGVADDAAGAWTVVLGEALRPSRSLSVSRINASSS